MKRFESIELFSGAGGLALGLHDAGFSNRALVELNANACATIKRNQSINGSPFSSCELIEGAIQNVDFRPFGGEIDLVAGGPPCQPFSLGGKHKGREDSRDLFPEAIRVVRELAPKAFVFENVKGLLRSSFSTYFEYILLQLSNPLIIRREGEKWVDHLGRLERHHTSSRDRSLEYRVVFRLLNAANFGVPQTRQRVFLVGFRKDLEIEWNFPKETHSYDALLFDKWVSGAYWERNQVPKSKIPELPAKLKNRLSHLKAGNVFQSFSCSPWKTVRESISDLPEPTDNPSELIHNHIFKSGAKSYKGHTGSPLDSPAKTLKAGVHGVPGGENMIRFSDGSVRYFTARESARLQTFPDCHIFEGAWSEIMRQLGNAVPVKLASVVGKSILTQINGTEKRRNTENRAIQSA